MRKELREKILAFNRTYRMTEEKAQDMDILVAALSELPPGQLKKLLTDEVLAVLQKYGYEGGE